MKSIINMRDVYNFKQDSFTIYVQAMTDKIKIRTNQQIESS